MRLKDYLNDKIVHILMYLLLMISVFFFLCMFKVPLTLMISIGITMIIFLFVIVLYDYYRKEKFYNDLIENLDILDEKYLITEIINKPNFLEGQIFYHSLYEIDKSMYERIEKYKINLNDFKEYIEMWIHEVKLPIASSTLILHNNKADANKKIKEQINRIENYVEQVLYFARSENSEKDYLIRNYNLEEIVNSVIKKNKDTLLLKHIKIEVEDLDKNVLTDSKWLEFVVSQIVSNSIKYSKTEEPKLIFKSREINLSKVNSQDIISNKISDFILLEIEDNGIGINEKDILNVFDKSFTGENGRIISNSTGMGLYLSKKLCEKLGHKISIKSEYNKYTKVYIYFKKDKYYSAVR
ncbi:MAG: sensor histidine kinase [Terrisporobacter sp.]